MKSVRILAWGLLAFGLAALTSVHVADWHSNHTLWTRTARVAPWAPRPFVNLAVEQLHKGDMVKAAGYLQHAAELADHQMPFDQAWSRDVIAANLAVIAIHDGQLALARRLVLDGPPLSMRWKVCQTFPTLCVDNEPKRLDAKSTILDVQRTDHQQVGLPR